MKCKLSLFLFCLIILLSCNKSRISYVTISFYNKNNKLDSVVLDSQEDIKLIDKVMSNKVQVGAKFPRKYYLKLTYNDSSFEEYDGNGTYLRAEHIYMIPDTEMQKSYLKLLNSKLPPYLKQD